MNSSRGASHGDSCREYQRAPRCIARAVVGFGLAELILQTFLTTPFEGGRHVQRLAEIAALEDEF